MLIRTPDQSMRPSEQLAQRRVVEERVRRGSNSPRTSAPAPSARPRAACAAGVHHEHLGGAEVRPHLLEPRHRLAPVIAPGRRARRPSHRAGGGADDDGKGLRSRGSSSVECSQHAHLVRRARTTTGQDQPDHRPHSSLGSVHFE